MSGKEGGFPETGRTDEVALIRAVLARRLPRREFRSLTALGEGLDNRAYDVDGDLIVRIAKDIDAGALRREADLLTAVSEFSPLPVPEPAFVDPEAGILAYAKLPGVPLLGHPVADPVLLAPALGRFLSALHQADGMARLAPADLEPPSVWLADARESHAHAASHIPEEYRRRVETFLATTPASPDEPPPMVFCHNDLGAEHILVDVDANTITGVIDWTDAAITDPMHDLALVYRDLGPEVFETMLSHYEGPCAMDRVLFYARCSVLEDIAYGLTTGPRLYADAGLAHLSWLFGE
jgi:aminoglycoside phosphotransferase (APT) family kinase protein